VNAPKSPPRRPLFQFSLLSLFVLMFVFAAASAPGYYMFRSGSGLPQARLVGTLMVVAGPLLIMTLVSLLLALTRRGD
jgi:hypothetical protein